MPRAKNTSRADARRRTRGQQRAQAETTDAEELATAPEVPSSSRPTFAMPDVAADIRALPAMFRRPTMWLPFGLLLLTFLLAVALVNGALDGLPQVVRDASILYVSLTLHPTTLFIFFIGGFVAPRGSYLVGGILGLLSGLSFVAVLAIAGEAAGSADIDSLIATSEAGAPAVTAELALQTIGMGVGIGMLAAGFAAWYRRFLRSSQERAKMNRAIREQEQARKAKEQARLDKQAAREAHSKRSS